MRHYYKNQCKQIVAETRERSFLLRFMRIPTRNSHVGACIFGHSTIVIFSFLLPLSRFISQESGLFSFRVCGGFIEAALPRGNR